MGPAGPEPEAMLVVDTGFGEGPEPLPRVLPVVDSEAGAGGGGDAMAPHSREGGGRQGRCRRARCKTCWSQGAWACSLRAVLQGSEELVTLKIDQKFLNLRLRHLRAPFWVVPSLTKGSTPVNPIA